jgi:hypothetical protein
MSAVSVGDHPGKVTISFLPILDLNPSDMTCIYSVLIFISEQAKHLHIETPVVTFDQPLWVKAMEIVTAKAMPIVLILGGFHLMMSYLNNIDTIMKVSGLSEAFQTIYSRNAVDYMMSGKSISRAQRGHLLVESALTVKFLRQFISVYIIENEDGIDENDNDASEKLTTETFDECVGEETDEDEVEDESVEADDCMADFDK